MFSVPISFMSSSAVAGGIPTDYTLYYTGINVSGSSLIDESANSYDGTISGAVVSGNFLDFDGTNDSVSVPAGATDNGNTWTHVLTIEPDVVNVEQRVFSARDPSSGAPTFLYRILATGALNIFTATSSGSVSSQQLNTDTATLSANTVYTIIVECDNLAITAYVNGTEYACHTHTLYNFLTVSAHYLGTNRDADGQFYNGGIKDVYVYNRVLTADERTAIFDAA